MSTSRQPKGIPVGGQYAENSHDEAGTPLSTITAATGWEEADAAIVYSEPTPQASNLDLVGETVESFGSESGTSQDLSRRLGIDKSEGGFYAASARLLGLVERDSHGQMAPTELGERYLAMDDDARRETLRRLANSYEGVRILREEGEDAAAEYLAGHNLSQTTIDRRLSTLQAWADYGDSDDYQRPVRNGNRAEPRKSAVGEGHESDILCSECFIYYPETAGGCPFCG